MSEAVSAWKQAAKSVMDLHIRFKGQEVRIETEPPSRGMPAKAPSEITIDFEIDYLLARPDNEVYSRTGTIPTDRGLKAYESRRVNFRGSQKELKSGGEDASRVYDQYVIRAPKAVHEPALEPLRFLLNVNHLGQKSFFDDKKFELVEGATQAFDGVECVSAETADAEGVRVWFSPQHPRRIYKLEVGLSAAERSGHVECTYRYSTAGAETAHVGGEGADPFTVPEEWQLMAYTPEGDTRGWITCKLLSVAINTHPGEEAFELPIPPGTIVADRRTNQPAYFLQLADGTQRPIRADSMGPELLTELAASVRGSRVANSVPDRRHEGPRGPLTFKMLIAANIAAVLIIGLVFAFVRMRRRRLK